ncbi:helix-turn-helix transcriptional regulator [Arcanobacterium haemolyticum]|nr:helix-turn-helix transcriptional regulator [Arcanobacterium haemolyticum]
MSTDTCEANVFSSACPSRETLQHLTGKWGALTMAALEDGALRFGEIRRRIDGVSERMLSQTLAQLERDGFVARHVLSAIPPHVEYELTELGRSLVRPLISLIDLVEHSMPDVYTARDAYDKTHS